MLQAVRVDDRAAPVAKARVGQRAGAELVERCVAAGPLTERLSAVGTWFDGRDCHAIQARTHGASCPFIPGSRATHEDVRGALARHTPLAFVAERPHIDSAEQALARAHE